MDLILLQPGDSTIVPTNNDWDAGGSLIGNSQDWIQNPPINLNMPNARFIELVSIHQGMKQQMTTDVSNSARTSGRPVITEFTCVKYVDKSSVNFYDRCLRAKPLGSGASAPTAIHICRNSGDQMANIMSFWLRDAMVSEIQLQSHPDDMPTEQFKLSFTEIVWQFSVQTADSKVAGNVSAQWSIAGNGPAVNMDTGFLAS